MFFIKLYTHKLCYMNFNVFLGCCYSTSDDLFCSSYNFHRFCGKNKEYKIESKGNAVLAIFDSRGEGSSGLGFNMTLTVAGTGKTFVIGYHTYTFYIYHVSAYIELFVLQVYTRHIEFAHKLCYYFWLNRTHKNVHGGIVWGINGIYMYKLNGKAISTVVYSVITITLTFKPMLGFQIV